MNFQRCFWAYFIIVLTHLDDDKIIMVSLI